MLKRVFKKYIDEWDPMSLLPYAPKDEYDIETERIYSLYKDNMSIEQIANLIKQVFDESFSESFSLYECISVAEKIYRLKSVK